MPTPTGSETIGEALTRLRAELAGVRQALMRSDKNGASFSMGGVSVTSVQYDRLIERAGRLEVQIRSFEARLAGTADSVNAAVFRTTRLSN